MAGDSSDLPRFITREGKILPGVRRVVNVPQPAAGSEWSVQVPAGVTWRVLGGQYSFGTSAVVGNRIITLQSVIDVAVVAWTFYNATIPASNGITVIVLPGPNFSTGTALNGRTQLFMPYMFLPAGAIIGSWSSGLDAGDQYSGIHLYIEELYATDAVLSEWHEREMEAYRAAIT